jgi:hypothetical protein
MNATLATNLATATIVDDDSPPVIQQITVNGGQATLWWSAVPGRMYRVQYKPDPAVTWNDLGGDVPATSPVASKADTNGIVARRYYRVKVLP